MLFQLYQQRALLDRAPRGRVYGADPTRGDRAKLVLHLHRLHHDESLPRLHGVADLHSDAHDEPRHRRNERRRSLRSGGLGREITNGARALVERFDLEAEPVEPQRIDAWTAPSTHDDTMHFAPNRHHAHRRAIDRGDLGRDVLAVDVHTFGVEQNLVVLAVDSNEISHASLGTSSHTVSTCAVCGNMSKARSDSMR